ncbi:MAG: putative ABC exporter domain-containing protein [Thermaurantimonas sp.]
MSQIRILLLKDLLILKNTILLALRKPWRWLFAVGFFGYFFYKRMIVYSGESIQNPPDVDLPDLSDTYIERISVILATFIGMLSVVVLTVVISRATRRNTTFFINADTHFLFPGPFHPGVLILYQLVKSIFPALLSSFVLVLYFFLFITPENIPFTAHQLGYSAIPLALFFFSIRPIQFLIFSVVSGGNAQRNTKRVLIVRNLIILCAFISVAVNFPKGDLIAVLKATFVNGTFQYVPYVGWFQSALVDVLAGEFFGWGVLLLGVSVFSLPVAVYMLSHQYYEDVLASTELRTRAEQIRSGETQMNDDVEYGWALNTRNIREHRNFGRGAVAFFWKNWVMAYRQTGVPFLDPTAIATGIFGLVCAVVILVKDFDSSDFSSLVIISVILLGMLSFSAGYMRVRIGDLTRPVFALIPDYIGRKVFFLLLMDLIHVSVYTLAFFIPVTIAYGDHWEIIPFSAITLTVVYLTAFLFQLNVRLSLTSFLDRYLFLPLGFLALISLCLLPSVLISIAAYGFFKGYGAAFAAISIVWGAFGLLLYFFALEHIDRLEY